VLRRMLILLVGLIGVSCTGGCAQVPFLPAEAALTLQHPTHVEAYRTGTLDDHPGYGGKMDGFAVFGTGAVTDDVATEVAAAIADPTTYYDNAGPEDFVPTLGFRFYRKVGGGQTSVDVLIGFDHDQVMVVARDNKQREDFRRLMDSTPGRARLVKVSQEAFEVDLEVQSLSP
jgi:hypothetical protein